MRIDIATLFTQMCDSVLSTSIIGRAVEGGHIEIHTHDIRLYTENKHRRVDDKPYGGGTGMVMQAQPVYDCVKAIIAQHKTKPRVIYMSPQGEVLTQAKVVELAAEDGLILLCGHYEGMDQRVLDELGCEELSVGDYVLTGGELPALIVADAVARMQKGVLPNEDAYSIESHFGGLLEYPQYTRPEVWRGREVPEVLLCGSHKAVADWQRSAALRVTAQKRPDMHEKYLRELTRSFWQGFIESKCLPQDTAFSQCVRFGADERESSLLLKLVMRGKKRVTISSLTGCEIIGGNQPQQGEYRIVTDWDGIPRCVIQTARVRVIPFRDITLEIFSRDGGFDSLEAWRESRERLFTEEGARLGYAFTEDAPMIVEEFRTVYKVSG